MWAARRRARRRARIRRPTRGGVADVRVLAHRIIRKIKLRRPSKHDTSVAAAATAAAVMRTSRQQQRRWSSAALRRLAHLSEHMLIMTATEDANTGGGDGSTVAAAAEPSAIVVPPSLDFAKQYFDGSVEILAAIRKDSPVLGAVAASCAGAISRGQRVFANLTMGHLPAAECEDTRAGNPAHFVFNCENYEMMKSGDVLLTHAVSKAVLAARERGVLVIAFTCPYVDHSAYPRGQIQPAEDNLLLEDVADFVVDTHIPWQQGLVHVPGRPEFPCFPSSGTATCAIFWALTAEVSARLAMIQTLSGAPLLTRAPPQSGGRAREYIDFVLERLHDVSQHTLPTLHRVGAAIAERVLLGGRLLVRGAHPGLVSETHWVASGLWLCDWYDRPHQRPDPHGAIGGDWLPGQAPSREQGDGGELDTLLIASIHSNEPFEIATAQIAAARGNFVVVVGPPHAEESFHSNLPSCTPPIMIFCSNQTQAEGGVLRDANGRTICPATVSVERHYQ